MNKIKQCIVGILVMCCITKNIACTIFTAADGQSVLVGNNEDNTPSLRSYLWYYPSKNGLHGFVTWGNEKKLPEGGMNDKGLFWDAAALPNKIPIVVANHKEKWKGYFVEKALSECATVAELLTLIEKYNLMWQEKAQVLVADAKGDFAIIHANYVIRKSDLHQSYFALSNYCVNDPALQSFQCHRQGYAEAILGKAPSVDKEMFKNILEKTAQTEVNNATLYSQICDLKKGIFHLYQKNNFTVERIINLEEELNKGEREVEIKSLFPKNVADEIAPLMNKKNYSNAIDIYRNIIQHKSKEYDLSFRTLDELGYEYLREKKFDEAIEVFKLNSISFPDNDQVNASLGCAYLAKKEFVIADQYFKEALIINAQNYTANLFKPNVKGTIIFKFRHFEGVEKISLAGTFNDFKPNINTFTKDADGTWTCTINLKPGEYRYKLIIGDGNWYNDPFNHFLINPNKYWDNYLYVE